MSHETSLLLATALYVIAAFLLGLSIARKEPGWRKASVVIALGGAAFHTLAQLEHWQRMSIPDASLLSLLSLCALAVVLMLCVSFISRKPLYDAALVALPLAATALLLEWALQGGGPPLGAPSPGTALHILSSVLAFGLLSIAGVYSLFVAIIDFFLRRHHLNQLVTALPPLEILEQLLFRLITGGFLLLTVSLASGLAFVSDLFEQHLVHKTILSILAWLVFGLLLWGRWRYGWRGRKAVRLTLAGIVLLLLAYFGSKFVLEVILGRSWQG